MGKIQAWDAGVPRLNELRKWRANKGAILAGVEPRPGLCHAGKRGGGLKRGAERLIHRQATHDRACPLGVTPARIPPRGGGKAEAQYDPWIDVRGIARRFLRRAPGSLPAASAGKGDRRSTAGSGVAIEPMSARGSILHRRILDRATALALGRLLKPAPDLRPSRPAWTMVASRGLGSALSGIPRP